MMMPRRVVMLLLPVMLFLLVISVNFFKPFGFFRESNPAMVCINANSWNAYPDLRSQHIPIGSYGFDDAAKPSTQTWNTVMTFGSGWFVVPYYFFSVFNLSPSEINIRIFSLFWLAFTLVAVYLLSRQLTRKLENNSTINYLTLIFYVFNAASLWYHVQGYVHEIAVLPFYFLSWLFFLKFNEKSGSVKWLILLSTCLFISVQFDWLACFQAAAMSIYLLMKRKEMQIGYAFLLPVASVLLGVAWIVYTYTHWATLPVYIVLMKEKFMKRTIGGGGLQLIHGLNYNFNLLLFYLTSFGLLCWFALSAIVKKTKLNPVVWLMVITAILHHLVFWGFSTEHDHGVMKMAFPVAFLAAVSLGTLRFNKLAFLCTGVIVINIGIYFFLHNYYERSGMYTNRNFCYEAGTLIREKFSAREQHVFIHTEGKYLLQVEFYAGKVYELAASLEDARETLHQKYPGGQGYFIDGTKGKVKEIIGFK